MPVPIGILENDHFLLNNYKEFFGDFSDLEICFAVQTLEEFQAVATQKKEKPAVVIMDVELGDQQGADLIRTVLYRFPATKVIVVAHDDGDDKIMKALHNGAASFLSKTAKMVEIYEAVLRVNQHGAYISSEIGARIVNYLNSRISKEVSRLLTNRELQLVMLLRNGMSYRQVAIEMNVTVYTINHHLKKIYQKLHVSSRSQLISKVRSSGWQ